MVRAPHARSSLRQRLCKCAGELGRDPDESHANARGQAQAQIPQLHPANVADVVEIAALDGDGALDSGRWTDRPHQLGAESTQVHVGREGRAAFENDPQSAPMAGFLPRVRCHDRTGLVPALEPCPCETSRRDWRKMSRRRPRALLLTTLDAFDSSMEASCFVISPRRSDSDLVVSKSQSRSPQKRGPGGRAEGGQGEAPGCRPGATRCCAR